MLRRYETKARIGLWFGLLVPSAGATAAWVYASTHSSDVIIIGIGASFVGLAIFIWGSSLYARAKGQSPWFGMLGFLGFLGLFGGLICIVILALLPDKYKNNPDGEPPIGPPPPPYHPSVEEPTATSEP